MPPPSIAELIDLQLLKTLVVIADTGSFAAAADTIGRTQSAVSMQVRRLEETVGDPPLFERVGRRMVLTERGEALLHYAKQILALYAETQAVLTATGGGVQPRRITLGVAESYVGSALGEALERFTRTHRSTEVAVIAEPDERLSRSIAEGTVDLALVAAGVPPPDAAVVSREALVWVTSPRHTAHLTLPLPLALYEHRCAEREAVLDVCASAGLNHRVAYSTSSLAGLLVLVESGLAVTALARRAVPGDMLILEGEDGFPALPPIVLALAYGKNARKNPAVAAVGRELTLAFERASDGSARRAQGPAGGMGDGRRRGGLLSSSNRSTVRADAAPVQATTV